MSPAKSLDSSIPANNLKIIEIYNKLRNKEIIVNNDYQRKLVWKQQHKFDFIETIQKNYPFPEIYLAPGELDQEKLVLIDEIVDGQQRLNCIENYVNGSDVFSIQNIPLKKFSELTKEQRTAFLNYEVSVRYLKNANTAQVREIFQRINRTDYALNKVERLNAQWGESEFVCFCKQIVEIEFDDRDLVHKMDRARREKFIDFFYGVDESSESVFSDADADRMLALQYMMTVIATMHNGEYFNRNDLVPQYMEQFNEKFSSALEIEVRLEKIIDTINQLQLPRATRWFNKANLFSLIVELDKVEKSDIFSEVLGAKLLTLDYKATIDQLGIEVLHEELSADERRYLSFAREAVNRKHSREVRGSFIRNLINHSLI